MELRCIRCNAPIAASDINLERFVAKCSSCHAVFRFEAEAIEAEAKPKPAKKQESEADKTRETSGREARKGGRGGRGARREREEREKTDAYRRIPDGIKIENIGNGLRFVRSWWSMNFFFFVPFALFWNGFLVMWYGIVTSSMQLNNPFSWIFLLFPLLHVGVGLGLAYFCLCLWFNRTIVQLRGGIFSIEHKPLPWFGAKKLPSDELEQLYCKEVLSNSKNGTNVTYEVHAILRNHRNIKLLSGLADAEQALFFEEAIEDYLGIEERPVRGEMRMG